MERDKYDEAIDWLVQNAGTPYGKYRSVVDLAWNWPESEMGGCLFRVCTKDEDVDVLNARGCGCLTQVRNRTGIVEGRPDLTAEIIGDLRIPKRISEIDRLTGEQLRAALQPFAEWQRRLDREIRT